MLKSKKQLIVTLKNIQYLYLYWMLACTGIIYNMVCQRYVLGAVETFLKAVPAAGLFRGTDATLRFFVFTFSPFLVK